MSVLNLAFALAIAMQDTAPRQAAPWPADAFADTGTANLIMRARARREREERLITSYEAVVTQRLGMGMRALRRDRMLFSQEMTARIHWRRDTTSTIEMVGAREAVPIVMRGVHIPSALGSQAALLPFDPSEDYLRLVGNDPEGMLYPLADSALLRCRYASGDTTRITLPSGREIRLIEVRVTPRAPSFHLLTGSLWFDADSWGVVRMVVRPSRAFDLELDGDSGDADDVPSIIKPVRFDMQYITVEYGLYQTRWWLPRLMALDGELTMGSFLKAPARFERTYVISRVTGGGEPVAAGLGRWRAGAHRPNIDSILKADSARFPKDTIDAITALCNARRDSARAARKARRDSTRGVQVEVEVRIGSEGCVRDSMLRALGVAAEPDLAVQIPPDTMDLLRSPDLGPPILDMGDVISAGDLRELGAAIGALPGPSAGFGKSLHLDLFRYNRVEALSAGARGALELGGSRLEGMARFGVGDLVLNAEASITRPSRSMDLRLGVYRALVSTDPPSRPLGLGNSLNALLFGRDDGEYYRTLGAALSGSPGGEHGQWMDWRLFAERQRPAEKTTNFSFAHLADGSRVFRPNIAAAPLDQAGARVAIRGFHNFGRALGVGSDLLLEAQTGDVTYGKAALTLRGTVPLAGAIVGFEAGAGSSSGPVPVQGLWYLGGPATLRGYTGGTLAGPAFWRGRLEIANDFPAARIALFSDAGWAGARPAMTRGTPLISAGVGASFLDGLLRVDLSRALRAPRGWRLDVYADGVL